MTHHRSYHASGVLTIAVSVLVHATVGLAAWWWGPPVFMRQPGSNRLEADDIVFESSARWYGPVVLDPPPKNPNPRSTVLIQPDRSWIAERSFIHTDVIPTKPDLHESDVPTRLSMTPPVHQLRARSIQMPAPALPPVNAREVPIPRLSVRGNLLPFAAIEELDVTPPLPGGGDIPPRLLLNLPPTYPPRAVADGWQGTVVLRVRVTSDGQVAELEVLESSGFLILDGEAVNTVRGWKFEPAQSDGKPVAATVRLPIRFTLD